MVLWLAMLAGIYGAIFLRPKRLDAPGWQGILIAGNAPPSARVWTSETRPAAARLRDEMGFLVHSFNDMNEAPASRPRESNAQVQQGPSNVRRRAPRDSAR